MSTQLLFRESSGPITDLIQKLSGKGGRQWLRALKRFLRRENPWSIPQNIEVTTSGRTGEQCITSLEEQGFRLGNLANELLRGEKFVATDDGTTHNLVVISGDEFEDGERTNANIRAEATRRGYLVPPMEVAPYLRELFSDEDLEQMGIWALVVMHESVTVSFGDARVLGVSRKDEGRWLFALCGRPDGRWGREFRFVFLAPASN